MNDTIRPKICHIVDTLNPGGLEKTLVTLVLGTKGFEHHVWCLKDRGVLAGELEQANVPLKEFGFSGKLTVSAAFRLTAALKKHSFHIVHCHGLFPSIWGRIAASFAGVPVSVVHCQNLYYDVARRVRLKLRLLTGVTTRFIAVSEAVKECLVSHIGVGESKITVIYNGAPDRWPCDAAEKRRIRNELGIGDDAVAAGCVARLEEHKGHAVLVRAVSLLGSCTARMHLVIVGDGPQRNAIEGAVRSCGLEGRVTVTGYRGDARRLLEALDIYVQPTLKREGLPVALCEAAAASLPLVATNVGGNAEIVRDGRNGFLVGEGDSAVLANALSALASDAVLRKRMGEEARSTWESSFNSDRMCGSVAQLYSRLLRT